MATGRTRFSFTTKVLNIRHIAMGFQNMMYFLWVPPILLALLLLYCVFDKFRRPPPTPLVSVPTVLPVHPAQTGDTCSICLEPLAPVDLIPALRCGHEFHALCLGRWLAIRPACPLCQAAICGVVAT